MKEIYQNRFLRVFVLDNGTYRVEARDFVNPEEYVLYAKGDTISQALARMQGRALALWSKLDGLANVGCEQALDWIAQHDA
ncbi:MAG: hypothetical protein ABIF77_00095 [bacterium]